MREYNPIPSAALLISGACIQCTVVYLLTLGDGTPGYYYPAMLLPYAMLLFAADRVFLRRERTLLGLSLVNGGLCVAAVLSVILLGGVTDLAGGVLAVVFCAWLAGRSGQLAQSSPTLFELILETDLTLIFLALFTAYLSAKELPVFWCVPITVGCACSVLGTIVFRSGAGLGVRSWMFLGTIFAGVLAMVWLLVSFVAAPAGEGLVTLWNWTVEAVLFLLNLLQKLLLFLASLFPAGEGGELPAPDAAQSAGQMEAQIQNDSILPILLLAVLAAGILVLAFVLLKLLGNIRLSRAQSGKAPAPLRRRVSLLAALRQLMAGVGGWISRRIWLWRNRNSAQGLYFLLVQRSSRTPWHKFSSETPHEFLMRLRDRAAGDPELVLALEALMPAVDRALFAPAAKAEPFSQARLVRHRLGAAVRRGMVQDAASGLRLRLRSLRGAPPQHSQPG